MEEDLKNLFSRTSTNHVTNDNSKLDHWKELSNAGPLPTPEVISAYEQLVPGTAKKFIDEYFHRLAVSSECLIKLTDYKEKHIDAIKNYKLKIIDLEQKYRTKILIFNAVILGILIVLGCIALYNKYDTLALWLLGVIALETIRATMRPPMLL